MTHLTDENFDSIVTKDNSGVILVDFSATWCGPCVAIKPIIEALSEEMAGKALIAELDADTNPEVCARFGIRSLPSLFIFKNGEHVDSMIGAAGKDRIVKLIEKHL